MPRIVHFAVAFLLWMLLTWSVDLDNILAGAIVAALSAALLGHLFPLEVKRIISLSSVKRVLWFIYYVPMFLLYCLKANFDVAYRVLHLNLPIRPGIVKVKTTLKGDMARTFLANSITLTPGTLTIDMIGDDMYIHWMFVESDDPAEQTRMIVSRFEKVLRRIFEP